MTAAEISVTLSDADREAIQQAALDYAEGWYNAAPDQTERSLHPHLAKRIVTKDKATGQDRLGQMSAMELVQIVRGKQTVDPVDKRIADVTILDAYSNAATLRVEMADWIDYLHVVKFNGEWKIINVLWALKPHREA